MDLSKNVKFILSKFKAYGYEAYIVGGCVRDILMGISPKDWDITTDASPDDIKQVFCEFKVIDTGILHGTLGILIENEIYEITTYRSESEYIKNRRPSKVSFIKDINSDLSRRDFTMNAIAYNYEKGLLDFFGGQEDILLGIIKCVGNPEQRFEEDALRILRALRFASEKGFEIEVKTYIAMCKHKKLILNVSKERISIELNKLLMGNSVANVFEKYNKPMYEIFPKLEEEEGYLKKCIAGIRKLSEAGAALYFRLASVFAETYLKERDINEISYYIKNLKFDNKTIEKTLNVIEGLSIELKPDRRMIKRHLNKYGEEFLKDILYFRGFYKNEDISEIESLMNDILDNKQCFSLKMLAVNGNDLIQLGVPRGKMIGTALQLILEDVIDGKIENSKEVLQNCAKNMI